tara:strand:- start:5158 stop:5865 length:708 start_codon:yes stop_codon:yes gene_type:complete
MIEMQEISPGSFFGHATAAAQKSIMPKEKFDKLFRTLISGDVLAYQQRELKLYGKVYKVPRQEIYIDDEHSLPYSYSGSSVLPNVKWSDERVPEDLKALKHSLEGIFHQRFDTVLINKYEDGKHGVDWHSDSSKIYSEQGRDNVLIVSISMGGIRRFDVRANKKKMDKKSVKPSMEDFSCFLGHGDLVVMDGQMQDFWDHRVPKMNVDCGVRVNLTFRTTLPYRSQSNKKRKTRE